MACGGKPEELTNKITIAGSQNTFWEKAIKYNKAADNIAAAGQVFIGLGDLENPNLCAPTLLKNKLNNKSQHFHLRVSERMLESWLVEDVASFASFFKIKTDLTALRTEINRAKANGTHPKTLIVNLTQKSSVKEIRNDMKPGAGSSGLVGKGYTLWMERHIEEAWRPLEAQRNNKSLEKAINCFKTIING